MTGEAELSVRSGSWAAVSRAHGSRRSCCTSSSGEQAQCFQDAEQKEGFGGEREIKCDSGNS